MGEGSGWKQWEVGKQRRGEEGKAHWSSSLSMRGRTNLFGEVVCLRACVSTVSETALTVLNMW